MSLDSVLTSKFWPATRQFFARVFIFLGLPLLAWGLGTTAGFFSNPVRTSFAVVVIVQALIYAWLDYRAPPHSVGEHVHESASLHAILVALEQPQHLQRIAAVRWRTKSASENDRLLS